MINFQGSILLGIIVTHKMAITAIQPFPHNLWRTKEENERNLKSIIFNICCISIFNQRKTIQQQTIRIVYNLIIQR